MSTGTPAGGLRIDLHQWHEGRREHLSTVITNGNGRTDEPLLSGDHLSTGVYELVFHAGAYFRAQGAALPDPPFLDEIVIRFGISDPAGKYHVPLLVAPYGYSTYRGS
jgi:5-hydroxyisourate hydrolase